MIRVSHEVLRELLQSIEEARQYIRRIDDSQDAALYRLFDFENKIRKLLGLEPLKFSCVHVCEHHREVKK